MVKMPKEVQIALETLENAKFEAYIVGGCVRDYLMGLEPSDIDVTTSALPEEVKAVFAEHRTIETGIKHGTVTVIIDNLPIEITTFRVEDEYLDGRHPSGVTFTRSLREDAARRDFTMNAIAMDLRGKFYDFFGGKQDIEDGIIRCVGNPAQRFEEDALRIMRAVRFASITGFEIEQKTLYAAQKCKSQLDKISAERIRVELDKLLCGKNAKKVLLENTDILEAVLPELGEMKDFDQKNPHHIYDVLEHTAVAVENISAEPMLRLATLFHDVGKPRCFSLNEAGIGHFYGHAKVSTDMTRIIMARLKYDNETKRQVLKLVECHDIQIELTEKAVKRALNKLGVDLMNKLIMLKRADNLAQSPKFSDRQEYYDRLESLVQKVLDEEACFSMKDLAVDGSMLIEAGMKPGKELGDTLKRLLDAVIEGEIINDREKLLEFAGFPQKNF